MGNSQSNFDFHKKYEFIQLAQDSIFQNAKILRNKQPNYEYIMLIDRYIASQNKSKICQQLTKFKQLYFQYSEFNFARVLDFSTKNDFKCNYTQISICLEYLRHSLNDYINWRKQNQSFLTYNQIIMAICCAIEAYQITQSYELIQPSLKLTEIYITQQGFIKFNPIKKKLAEQLIQPLQQTCSNIMQCKQAKRNEKITQIKYIHSYLSAVRSTSHKQHKFLLQLKHFVNEIVWNAKQANNNIPNNPQDQYFLIYQKKQIKRLLKSIHLSKTIQQVKQIIGQPVIQAFSVQEKHSSRLSHKLSQAKLQRIVTQLSQKTMEEIYDKRKSFKNSIGKNKFNYSIF